MKKIILFLVTLCAIASCTKQPGAPLSYSVTNDAKATGVFDIYIADTGTYDMAVLVKFLTGSPSDSVALSISGLPANVTVSPDTVYRALPTYTEHFIFTSLDAPLGTHPVTLTSSVTNQASKTYNFNIIVLPANSATIFLGSFTTNNVCSATNYAYTATCFIADTTGINVLYINNFGGYGPEANARVLLNPVNTTATIPQQSIGNGVSLSGSGTYTANTLIINYTAVRTPGGPADNCTATIVKQ